MKIVYCIAGTRHSGGMERVLANKANYLVNHGYEITIITTDQYGEKTFKSPICLFHIPSPSYAAYMDLLF